MKRDELRPGDFLIQGRSGEFVVTAEFIRRTSPRMLLTAVLRQAGLEYQEVDPPPNPDRDAWNRLADELNREAEEVATDSRTDERQAPP
jgi:hypothetical protein